MTTDRLKVTYVVPDLGIGGAERHAVTLMTHLDATAFDPSVVCIGRPGELFDSLSAAGIPSVALGRTKRQAFTALKELVHYLRDFAPDVVIVRGFNAEFLGRIAAVIARVHRVIVWVHNCGDTAPRGRFRYLSDRALDTITDAYFGVAHQQVDYMVQDLGFSRHKIRIIHNGVDPRLPELSSGSVRAELDIDESHQVVGTLSALRPEKDHETFLKAARLVLSDIPTARFLIVGDGQRRHALEALARDLGILDKVIFAGQRDDVAGVLLAMDVFVLSSYTVECFPMALLEAMACSRAAVCTAVGGVPEIVEDGVTGFLVPAKDPEALAERLSSLLRSPGELRRFGQAGRARMEAEFTLQQSVAEAERQIIEVATAGPRHRRKPVHLALVMDETFIGGVELLMLEVFKSFDPRTVVPRLICLRTPGPLAADFRASGFDVEVLHRTGRFDLRTLPRLVKSFRKKETDAVLVTHHHRAALVFGRLAARLGGVSTSLIAAHDMDLTSVGKRCLPRSTVATLKMSSALVLLSPRQGQYLHREEGVGRWPWSRTREVVIPNGVRLQPLPSALQRSAARGELGVEADEFVVGIVARLSAQKAHHVLFEAFALLLRSQPCARLVVVGGGERASELHDLARRLGISDRVTFTGIRRDVLSLLPAFDVACLSSVHEGVPMTVIECMAAGIPIVATDSGSLADMVDDGEQGFIVPVGDSAGFAERLVKLAGDPQLRLRQGRSARHRVERKYRIEQTTEGYETLLAELVGAL
jgi:glycosyltransferase involved in cell wall biosynthesis